MLNQVKRIGAVFAGVLAPPACFSCRRFASFESRFPLCPACASRWELNLPPRQPKCAVASPVHFAMPYGGVARRLIQRFKIEEADYLAPLLRDAFERWIAAARPDFSGFDALVPIPSHNSNFFRSWTSSARIAEILSGLTGLPVRPLLRRARAVRKQSLLSKDARRANVRGAFEAAERGALRGSYLLVDDVLTTGYTADACAGALLARGAARAGLFAAACGETAA